MTSQLNFTLDQLRVLDAAATEGSLAGAARRLHRVPSAITYQVQELESAVGVPLIERAGRSVRLTAAGERILLAAREVLYAASDLERAATDLAGGWESELRVVVDGALPLEPLTSSILRLAAAEIPSRLRLDVQYKEGVLDSLASGAADLALYLGFDAGTDTSAWEVRPLAPLEMLLVVSAVHPLRERTFDPDRPGHDIELVVRDSSPMRSGASSASFIGSRNVFHLSDFHSKRVALLAGVGYGWIPRHLVADDLEAGRLVLVPASLQSWTYEPVIVWGRQRPLGRAGRLFVDSLLEAG
jgi:DNA-binding transcriptional LysR family regulator